MTDNHRSFQKLKKLSPGEDELWIVPWLILFLFKLCLLLQESISNNTNAKLHLVGNCVVRIRGMYMIVNTAKSENIYNLLLTGADSLRTIGVFFR